MKTRHLLLGAGFVLAASVAVLGDRTPSTAISEPAKPLSSVTRASASISTGTKPVASNPAPSTVKMDGANAPRNGVLALYERQQLIGRDDPNLPGVLFAPHSWTPPPPPPPKPLPPPPPMAPPLPFKYLGKLKEADQWQVFLVRDSSTFIVRLNDVIENQYRVQQINPPSMTLLYLPLNQTQSLTIE